MRARARPRESLLACLAALAGILLTPAGARGEAENWGELLAEFNGTWRIDGEESPGLRSKLRAQKRKAAKTLRGSQDGRAVPVLLRAHVKQLKFVEKLRKQWAERRRKWEKLEPAMRRALQAKPQTPDGKIPVTPAEQEWLEEQQRLDNLYREITNEEEIAEYVRMAAARVVNTVQGAEYDRALKELLKAAGTGKDPEELEFIRLLGYVRGEPVTQALLGFADDMRPLVAQAALEALGRQNAPGSIDVLLARLQDPRWQLRIAALQGLSFYREPRVVEALLEGMKKEDGVIQRHYFGALCRMWGESVAGTVKAFVSWWAANKARVLERWASAGREGPVMDDPPAIMVSKSGHGGSTSFYGLKTDSKHIIFVIDISGSMGEQGGVDEQGQMRVDVAKRELVNAIRSLAAEDGDERGQATFNVVSYNAEVQVFKAGKMIPATKRNKEKAFAWIEKLQAIGATNIFDALVQAFEIIGTRRLSKQYEEGADTVFLMTDGKPTAGKVMDPQLIRQEIGKINRDRKITIHTIGVGKDHDADFLRKLAAENNGEYLAR